MAKAPSDSIDTGSTGPRSGGKDWSKTMPPGTATNLHKNMRTGMARTDAEDKALTSAQVERKPR